MTDPHFAVWTSNHLPHLLDKLAATLRADPLSPLEEEIIIVQSQGMRRWVTLELARKLGCAASLRMPFPANFAHRLAEEVLEPIAARGAEGGEADRQQDEAPGLFSRRILTWRILALLQAELSGPVFAPLTAYLADGDQRKRYQLAAQLARLFDDYQLYRPDMLRSWEEESGPGAAPGPGSPISASGAAARASENVSAGSPGPAGRADPDPADGRTAGEPVPTPAAGSAGAARLGGVGSSGSRSAAADLGPAFHEAAAWQASLWRKLRDGAPGEEDLGARFQRLIATLDEAGAPLAGLPARVSVFGVTTLPPVFVDLLRSLARVLPVSVYLVSPAPTASSADKGSGPGSRAERPNSDPGTLPGNPLLASLNPLGREFMGLLLRAGEPEPRGAPTGVEVEGQSCGEGDDPCGEEAVGLRGGREEGPLGGGDRPRPELRQLEFFDPGRDSFLHALQSDIAWDVDRGGLGITNGQDESALVVLGKEGPQGGEERGGPLRGDRALGSEAPRLLPLDPSDRSLQVHICHSPLREMEVLRDLLLEEFERDETLRPHDVLVMVPDISAYAPFIEAVFGVEHEGTPRLPFRIADRRLAQEQPLAQGVLQVLGLVDGRLTATEVLDLLEVPALRRAAKIEAADLPVLRGWVRDTCIRWGRDGRQRQERFGLPDFEANTWRAGLDRLLMGFTTGPLAEMVVGVLPHGETTMGRAGLLGAFAVWVDSLFTRLEGLRRARSLAGWNSALTALLEEMFEPEGEDEEEALQLVRGELSNLRRTEELTGGPGDLEPGVVRDHLETALADDSLGRGFLGGRITFCAMKPMRTIPFPVIAIAGLDDDSFPRRDRPPAFDLVAADPRPGDRSLRADDRRLFLESLLAAGRRLIISYVGRSAVDDSERAASVAVSELLDYLDQAFEAAGGRPARELVTVVHPLQPFSAAYFDGRDRRLFSYSAENCRAGAVALGERGDPPRFAAGPVIGAAAGTGWEDRDSAAGQGPGDAEGELSDQPPPAKPGPPAAEATAPAAAEAPVPQFLITLAELAEGWVNPCKTFCRKTLGLRLPRDEADLADDEPVVLDTLDQYKVSQWLLDRRVGGEEGAEPELAILAARGELPPAGLGRAWQEQLTVEVQPVARAVGTPGFLEPQAVHLEGEGWVLSGQIDGLTETARLQYRPATLKAKDRLRAWIVHVALNAWAATLEGGGGASALASAPGEAREGEGPASARQGRVGPPVPGGEEPVRVRQFRFRPADPGDGVAGPLPSIPRTTRLIASDKEITFQPLDNPAEILQALIDGYRELLRAPVPLFEKSAYAWAELAWKQETKVEAPSGDPMGRAWGEWVGNEYLEIPGDRDEPYIALCYRDREPLGEGETAALFREWARRLWWPIFERCKEKALSAADEQGGD